MATISNPDATLSAMPTEIVVMILNHLVPEAVTYQRNERENIPKALRTKKSKRARDVKTKNEALSLLIRIGATCNFFKGIARPMFWKNIMIRADRATRWYEDVKLAPVVQTAFTTIALNQYHLPLLLELNVQHLTIDFAIIRRFSCRGPLSLESLQRLKNVKDVTICCKDFELLTGASFSTLRRDIRHEIEDRLKLTVEPTHLAMRTWKPFIALFKKLKQVVIQRQPISTGGVLRDKSFMAMQRATNQICVGPVSSWKGRLFLQDSESAGVFVLPPRLLKFRLERSNNLIRALDSIFLEDLYQLVGTEDLNTCLPEKESRWVPYERRLPIVDGWFSG